MPRGANPKREREYTELVSEFQQEHRYPGRQEEVAARIVNKQRAEHDETRSEQADDRAGRSPDRQMPIRNYDRMTVDEITRQLDGMDEHELEEIRHYEMSHDKRKTLMEQLDRRMHPSHH